MSDDWHSTQSFNISYLSTFYIDKAIFFNKYINKLSLFGKFIHKEMKF